MSSTVDPRIAILSALSDPPINEVTETPCVPWDDAVKLLADYRAAVLREAVVELSALLAEEHEAGAIVDRLSEIADEAQKQAEGAR